MIGLAFLSQQYSLLVAVPLFFLAPATWRFSYVWSAALTVAVVAIPLVVVTSGSAAHFILLGTGTTGGVGGALLWQAGFHGNLLLVVSRGLPLLIAGAVAWVAARRLGPRALEPVPLLSVVAVSLALRLVFEQQIFLYYFMALTVALLLLAVIRGRFSGALVAWLLLVPTVFVGEISGFSALDAPLRLTVLVLALGMAFRCMRRGAAHADLAPWLAVAATTVVAWSPTGYPLQLPVWFWQVVLVGWGLALAAGPLVTALRQVEAPAIRRSFAGSLAWNGVPRPRPAAPIRIAG